VSSEESLPTTLDVARAALIASVDADEIGEHLGQSEAGVPGLIDERFECLSSGYLGWYWAVNLSVLPGAQATVNDIVLLPGDAAITAPAWMPYKERIQPGDIGPGDVLPPDEDDIRLAPAWFEGDPEGTTIADRHFAREVGLGRKWVLSLEGREDAADRWYDGDSGPDNDLTSQAPGKCVGCGFLISLAGDLSDRFGVCANRMSGSDGRVVALSHGCGAHSGTRPKRSASALVVPDPIYDTQTPDVEEF
jgi:hypothetical protein